MNLRLKLEIYEAIEKVIEKNCNDATWDGYIDPYLVAKMANAAELVFDASMEGQEYARQA